MRPISLTIATPILGFLLAVSLALWGHRTVRSEIAACISEDCFDAEAAANLEDTIAPFVRGSRYEGKINTRTEPQDEFLNIYLAKTKPHGRLASIRCNCAYIGISSIVCDKDFLSTFANTVSFTRGSIYGKDADAIWAQQQALFARVDARVAHVLRSWILGHEVAHAILHGENGIGRRKPFTEAQEYEADRYFIDRALKGADTQQIRDLTFGLTQFMFAIIGIAMNGPGSTPEAASKAAIAPSADGVHPPWLIRALKLGQRISELSENRQPDDFYNKLAGTVVVESGGIDLGSMCASENLRELQAKLQERRLGNANK